MNRFELAHLQRGDLTDRQEAALVNLAARLGRSKFNHYRKITGVGQPIPRLTKQEAACLLAAILTDLNEAQQ